MSSISKLIICTLFVLIGLMAETPRVVHAINCGQVSQNIVQCVPYLSSRSSLGHCCAGIRSLNSIAKTTADRQNVCRCLKTLAAQFRRRHNLDFNLARQLPGICKVNIRYTITSQYPDCAKVK